MNTFQIVRHSIIILGASIVGAIVLVGPLSAAASGPASDSQKAQFEKSFFEKIIPHHAGGVALGELCLQKAVHDELRAMCGEMVQMQTEEINTQHQWSDGWYNNHVEPVVTEDTRNDLIRLSSKSGEAFEIDFMQTLIRHHDMAIAMSEECINNAYHNELISMCKDMKSAQTEENAQVRMLLRDWYGTNGSNRPDNERKRDEKNHHDKNDSRSHRNTDRNDSRDDDQDERDTPDWEDKSDDRHNQNSDDSRDQHRGPRSMKNAWSGDGHSNRSNW